MVVESIRPFFRTHDGLKIVLQLEDWPAELPLPPNTSIVGMGEDHKELVHPYWRFVFESEKTIQVVGGWFKFALPLPDTIDWYKKQLSSLGWHLSEESNHRDDWTVLLFVCPEKNARLRLSLQRWENLNETRLLVARITEHVYAYVEEIPQTQIPLPIAEEAIR
ncbi:MAG: hypothetical protein AAB571_06990 [Chloroflexota bacterium]